MEKKMVSRRAIKTCVAVELQPHSFLLLALYEDECFVCGYGSFFGPGERAPTTV
jgi:hypothetical protein